MGIENIDELKPHVSHNVFDTPQPVESDSLQCEHCFVKVVMGRDPVDGIDKWMHQLHNERYEYCRLTKANPF